MRAARRVARPAHPRPNAATASALTITMHAMLSSSSQRLMVEAGTSPVPKTRALGGLPTRVPMPPMLALQATLSRV